MRITIYTLFILFISFNSFSEEILRSALMPLSDDDYSQENNSNCKSFSNVLLEAKNEWKHVTPFKLTEESLNYFLLGYNMQEELEADIVTVWPSYQGRRDQYYVLIGNNNCFVKWLEILPNSIQELINNGIKSKLMDKI